MTAYSAREGYRLFEADTFSPEVGRYLSAESRLLSRLAHGCDILVEIGCGKAEHLDWAWRRGMSYVGIDPCVDFLDTGAHRGRRRWGRQPQLVCAGIEAVDEWRSVLGAEPQRALIFVPFNCLGNLPDARTALAALSQTEAPFLVSVFTSSPDATLVRRQYYRRAGYSVTSAKDPLGRRFRSGARLNSLGFAPAHLLALARRVGLRAHAVPLGSVGVGLVRPPSARKATSS